MDNELRDCLQRNQYSSDELEMILIDETLKKFGNNKTHAAIALDISIRTLRNKLNRRKLNANP